MAWHGHLALRFRRDGERSLVHDRHVGPLRVLKSLHDEPGVCQSVLVHPPGGIVGGDRLTIEVDVEAGAHALITTPGATRFYRSAGEAAAQHLSARVRSGARLEWLPLESIAFDGCLASNASRFELDPGAETIGWDLTALGLPASGRPFESGRYTQEVAVAGRWLDRGTVRGDDRRSLDSPLGWAGRRVLATLWFAAGSDLEPARRERLVDLARSVIADASAPATAPCVGGVTGIDRRVVVVRVLGAVVEPAIGLVGAIRAAWRHEAWAMNGAPPRVWRT